MGPCLTWFHAKATFYILKHVDRPFEAKLVKPLVHIPPEDRAIATVVAYCEESKSTGVARRLFLVIIENNASPARPKDKSDLSCLLVNADGKVLEKDSDYWDSLPRDAQEGSGAVDTKGPPFLAQTILKLSPITEGEKSGGVR